MTFAERLARSQALYEWGKSREPIGDRSIIQEIGGEMMCSAPTRADLASYWLGATERDRVRAEP